MNQSTPFCKLTITPLRPWFRLALPDICMPDTLKPARFARFDYKLDFAGRSPRGICLSVKESTDPAKIGPHAILEKTPSDWVAFPAIYDLGLLVRTNQPRLCFV